MARVISDLDATLVALADPTRRSILRQLVRGEARVTDLARPYHISLNSVSKHIRVLERAQLVRRRRVGREHLLSFNPVAFDRAVRWMEEQRVAWMGAALPGGAPAPDRNHTS